MQKLAFNSQKTGFLSGLILPVVSLIIFYLFRYRDITLTEFLEYTYFRGVLSSLLSLNILPNLVLFYLFIRKNYLFSARGVLLATFVFAGLVLIIKITS